VRLRERHHPDTDDYVAAVLWQAHAGALWHWFTIALRRALATALGIPVQAFRDHARLSYAKVAACRRRGLVHFHAVLRLDGPDGPAEAADRRALLMTSHQQGEGPHPFLDVPQMGTITGNTDPIGLVMLPHQGQDRLSAADTNALEVLGLLCFGHGRDRSGVLPPRRAEMRRLIVIRFDSELLGQDLVQPEADQAVHSFAKNAVVQLNPPPRSS
jgi:hypothetical protein